MDFEEYKRKCYYLGRYQEILRERGDFDEEATFLIETALREFGQQGISFMEEMIKRGDAYDRMDERFAPILIYVGDVTCYGVLDAFARSLGEALEHKGCIVEYFNPCGDRVSEMVRLEGKRYRAVIGMQTFAFSVKQMNGVNIHDTMGGPKVHMIFDHPALLREQLLNGPEDYIVLTQDADYAAFITTYYSGVKKASLLPPAGKRWLAAEDADVERIYPLSFLGSYNDWRLWKRELREQNRKTRGIARRFVTFMLAHRRLTWEAGLEGVLRKICDETGNAIEDSKVKERRSIAEKALAEKESFLQMLYDFRSAFFVVSGYVREKVIEAILSAGIPMDVFGESFRRSRFKTSPYLTIHEERRGEDALEVYARSEVSLNVMSWHKAGMTERICNMMLNGAVVMTDESAYLSKHYTEGEDYLSYRLDAIDHLPGQLKELLADKARRERIRHAAYVKAIGKETWEKRADDLLDILEEWEK